MIARLASANTVSPHLRGKCGHTKASPRRLPPHAAGATTLVISKRRLAVARMLRGGPLLRHKGRRWSYDNSHSLSLFRLGAVERHSRDFDQQDCSLRGTTPV